MGSKAAGIAGGILVLLGVAGLISLWLFIIQPVIANATGLPNMYMTITLIDQYLFNEWVNGGGNPLLYKWILDPYTEVVPGLTLPGLLMVVSQILTIPPQGPWGLDLNLCIYGLVGILGVGAILAIVAGVVEE